MLNITGTKILFGPILEQFIPFFKKILGVMKILCKRACSFIFRPACLFIIIFILVILIWGGYIFFMKASPTWFIEALPEQIAQKTDENPIANVNYALLGDSYGFINTFFAGLALLGVIVTIRQQAVDLKTTKEEMREQTRQFQISDFYRRVDRLNQLEKNIPIYWSNELIKTLYQRYFCTIPEKQHVSPLFMLAYASLDVMMIFYRKREQLDFSHIEKTLEQVQINKRFLVPWFLSFSCLVEDYNNLFNEDKDLLRILLRTYLSSHDFSSLHMLIYMFQNSLMSGRVLPIIQSVQLDVDFATITEHENPFSIIQNENATDLFHKLVDGKITIPQAILEWEIKTNKIPY